MAPAIMTRIRAGIARTLKTGIDTNMALIRMNGHIIIAIVLSTCASVKFIMLANQNGNFLN